MLIAVVSLVCVVAAVSIFSVPSVNALVCVVGAIPVIVVACVFVNI